MSAKVGDTVRFLNSVGGGRVVRIEGQIAYIDEDGFETPALLRECVVVASGDTFYKSELRAEKASKQAAAPEPAKTAPEAPKEKAELPPVVETPEGELLNLMLAFEPANIKRLSDTTFDAFFVNDSNYGLYLSISTKAADSEMWQLRYAGFIEPAVQEFVFELTTEDLPAIDRISIQGFALKRTGDYRRKNAIDFERRLDATKFARLHCFDRNRYFDSPVLALEVVSDDRPAMPVKALDTDELRAAMSNKQPEQGRHNGRHASKPSHKPAEILEIDLHAGELLDTLNGLSKADILNYQIDTFRKVMDENLRFPGKKIVFIHGKGEGVLRTAILKELNHRYKGHDVADASFREYGFGATQVTIRRQNPENFQRKPRLK